MAIVTCAPKEHAEHYCQQVRSQKNRNAGRRQWPPYSNRACLASQLCLQLWQRGLRTNMEPDTTTI